MSSIQFIKNHARVTAFISIDPIEFSLFVFDSFYVEIIEPKISQNETIKVFKHCGKAHNDIRSKNLLAHEHEQQLTVGARV